MNLLNEILEIIEENKDREFLIDSFSGQILSYGQFAQRAFSISSFIEKLGLAKGDRVCIYLKNSIEFVFAYFACLFIGIIVVPINPNTNNEDKKYIFNRIAPKAVITSGDLQDGLPLSNANNKPKIIVFDQSGLERIDDIFYQQGFVRFINFGERSLCNSIK